MTDETYTKEQVEAVQAEENFALTQAQNAYLQQRVMQLALRVKQLESDRPTSDQESEAP